MTSGPGDTRLRFEPGRVMLSTSASEVVLDVGPQSVADSLFRHDPPTGLEVEQAIDAVEDALEASRLRQTDRGELVTDDPLMGSLPGLEHEGAQLSRDDIEALFQRLASAALGRPDALAGLAGGPQAAALLILRECMHHLGFVSIRRVAADTPGAARRTQVQV